MFEMQTSAVLADGAKRGYDERSFVRRGVHEASLLFPPEFQRPFLGDHGLLVNGRGPRKETSARIMSGSERKWITSTVTYTGGKEPIVGPRTL